MVYPKARLTYTLSSSVNVNTSFTASPVRLMSLQTILVGILVLLVATPLQAQPLIPSANSYNFEYKHYCSSSLTEVIEIICGGPYKSQPNAHYGSSNSGTFSSNSLKRLAVNDGIYFRSIPTERVHECCIRPCGYSELKMYCADV